MSLNDVVVAKKLCNLANSSRDRGIEFDLPFQSLKNVMKAKRCYFTGLPLTKESLTIDRVDAHKGYVRGNVVACHSKFNSIKGMLEERLAKRDVNLYTACKGLNKVIKRLEEHSNES